MQKFIKWKILSKLYYENIVKKLIEDNFPEVKYSAWLLWYWSDVLWFDTKRSTDHDWWPRMLIFLEEKDFSKKDDIKNFLSLNLPSTFLWYSTHFWWEENWVKYLEEPQKNQNINHKIEFYTINSFLKNYLNINDINHISEINWLLFSEQKLRTLKHWEIFHDDIWLKKGLKKLEYYPDDIWYYLMISEWIKISQEQQFIWRTWDVWDEIWSSVITWRLIQSVMRLCFLMEKEYSPYSKWFWTWFLKLKSWKKLEKLIKICLYSENWKDREKLFWEITQFLVKYHNKLKITKKIKSELKLFYDRPYLVIWWDNIANEIKKLIKSNFIKNLKYDIWSINQITNTTDILENNEIIEKFNYIYK